MRNFEFDDSMVVFIPHPDDPVYQPSVISTCSFTECDGMVKHHSDIHMILREKSFANMVSPETLRQMVDDIMRPTSSSSVSDLSDDQLFETIFDKRANDFNDIYQITRHLHENAERIKSRIEQYKTEKKKTDELKSKLFKTDKS